MRGSHDIGEGDVPVTRPIFCPGNYSLRNWRLARAEWAGAVSCWDRRSSMISSVGQLWYKAARHETTLTVPSRKCRPLARLAVISLHIITCVGGLPSKSCNEDPVGTPPLPPKKTLFSQIVLTANHTVHDVTSCQHLLGSFTNFGREGFINISFITYSNMVERGNPQVPLVVSVRTCAVTGHWKRQQRHTSQFGVLVDVSGEDLSNFRTKRRVPPIIIHSHCAVMVSKIAAKPPSPSDSSSYTCAIFLAPKHSLPDAPQWNNSSCHWLSASHKTQHVM